MTQSETTFRGVTITYDEQALMVTMPDGDTLKITKVDPDEDGVEWEIDTCGARWWNGTEKTDCGIHGFYDSWTDALSDLLCEMDRDPAVTAALYTKEGRCDARFLELSPNLSLKANSFRSRGGRRTTQAKITATAYIEDQPMIDLATGEPISWTTESSTDLPCDALGEAVSLCLGAAWKTGIDPAVEPGFHIRVTFT